MTEENDPTIQVDMEDDFEELDPIDQISQLIQEGQTFSEEEINQYIKEADMSGSRRIRKGVEQKTGRKKVSDKDAGQRITVVVAKENEDEIRNLRTSLYNQGILEKDSLNDLGVYGLNLVRMLHSGKYMVLPCTETDRTRIVTMGKVLYALNQLSIPGEYLDKHDVPQEEALCIYTVRRALDMCHVWCKVEAAKMQKQQQGL